MGKPSVLVAGAGLGAALILWTARHPPHHAPAAARTVIVHSVTRVAVAHPLLTGTEIVIIAVAAIVAASAAGLAIALNLIARLS